MLRAFLSFALFVVIFGLGFYAGRVTMPPTMIEHKAATPPQASEPIAPPAVEDTATRGRSVEPPASPPEVVPSVATSSGPPVMPAAELPLAPTPPPGDGSALMNRNLALPISGLKKSDIQDTFNQTRGTGERLHEAADIMSQRGTPVLAVDNGIVAKLFNSKQGGLTIYQFDSTEKFCYYYAHLDRYAPGVRDGILVKRGDTIGYVGSTGNADPSAPHLHFAIFELGPDKQWWEGKPINPYPLLMKALK